MSRARASNIGHLCLDLSGLRVVAKSAWVNIMKTAPGVADLMANARQDGNPDRRAGDGFVYVKDCRIWAEISYLDSPTEYRECLPVSRTPSHHVKGGVLTEDACADRGSLEGNDHDCDELQMLGNENYYLSEHLTRLLLLLLAIIAFLISGYLLCRHVDLL